MTPKRKAVPLAGESAEPKEIMRLVTKLIKENDYMSNAALVKQVRRGVKEKYDYSDSEDVDNEDSEDEEDRDVLQAYVQYKKVKGVAIQKKLEDKVTKAKQAEERSQRSLKMSRERVKDSEEKKYEHDIKSKLEIAVLEKKLGDPEDT
jgi:hypothetical protein